MTNNFSIEELSLIEWAESQNKILDFFDIIDKNITNEDVNKYTKQINSPILFENMERKDQVETWKIWETKKKIKELFSNMEWEYLKIPRIIS